MFEYILFGVSTALIMAMLVYAYSLIGKLQARVTDLEFKVHEQHKALLGCFKAIEQTNGAVSEMLK